MDEYGQVPHLSSHEFARLLFERCPLLAAYRSHHAEFMARFKEYIHSIPVFGGILLNASMTHVLMVRGWHGKSWSFPKGKINEGEAHLDCGAREVEEEVGVDVRHLMKERDFLSQQNGAQFCKLFIVVGVPDDGSVVFAPRTRKEVSQVAWFLLDDIPSGSGQGKPGASRFWAVREFIGPLQAWIAKERRKRGAPGAPQPSQRVVVARKKRGGKSGGGGASGGGGKKQGGGVRVSVATGAAGAGGGGGGETSAEEAEDVQQLLLMELGGGDGAGEGGATGWSAADMFATNEALIGRRFTYDGNPYDFGQQQKPAKSASAPSQQTAAVGKIGPLSVLARPAAGAGATTPAVGAASDGSTSAGAATPGAVFTAAACTIVGAATATTSVAGAATPIAAAAPSRPLDSEVGEDDGAADDGDTAAAATTAGQKKGRRRRKPAGKSEGASSSVLTGADVSTPASPAKGAGVAASSTLRTDATVSAVVAAAGGLQSGQRSGGGGGFKFSMAAIEAALNLPAAASPPSGAALRKAGH